MNALLFWLAAGAFFGLVVALMVLKAWFWWYAIAGTFFS